MTSAVSVVILMIPMTFIQLILWLLDYSLHVAGGLIHLLPVVALVI